VLILPGEFTMGANGRAAERPPIQYGLADRFT